ncbi:hypothetical protein AB832_07405 [Flavobacteriaceae bacterium (ex Bugula neritina AB1)]|nr:hypothetical protein AB832_07405 [Flavobacteriaceae bacterium (ex Bugula neritina AB1)]
MSFSGKINQFKVDAIEATEETRKAAIIALFRSVIQDTPVDTGRLRGNWQASINNPESGTIDAFNTGTSVAIAAAIKTVEGSQAGETLYLVNNLPYAEKIEYGYSQQAPQGMVRRNLSRITQIIRQAAQDKKV